MKKFEYFLMAYEPKLTARNESALTISKNLDMIQAKINDMAAEGWRLISTDNAVLFFEREIVAQ